MRREIIIVMAAMSGWQLATAAGDPRLVQAAINDDSSAVRALLEQKANVNSPAPDGTTALHWAVRADDLRMVEALLAAGANPKASDRYGLTPVSLACSNANARILKLLLDAGADPNSPDPQGTTALMIAARTAGGTDAVKLLLERGANVNARDSVESTALMWAVRANHPEALDILIHHDAEINARTRKGNPPPRRGPDSGGGSHGLGIVRSGWPERGYQEPTPGEMTALLYAARDGRIEMARTLLAANAQVNQVEANGVSPLVMATANNHIDVAQLLLEHGADANTVDWWGRTPLWTAVDLRDLEVNKTDDNGVDRAAALRLIRALLDRGANVNARTKEVPPLRRFLMPISDLSWVDVTGQTAVPARVSVGRPHRHALTPGERSGPQPRHLRGNHPVDGGGWSELGGRADLQRRKTIPGSGGAVLRKRRGCERGELHGNHRRDRSGQSGIERHPGASRQEGRHAGRKG